jgi:PAS domain S-box-containing protein
MPPKRRPQRMTGQTSAHRSPRRKAARRRDLCTAVEALKQRADELLGRAAEGSAEAQALLPECFQQLVSALEGLQVGQEQLRQQNEELAAAQCAADAERRRYEDLFEFAPDGYLVTDTQGTMREANRAAAELLETTQGSLVGKPLASFIAKQAHAEFFAQLGQLRSGATVRDWRLRLKPRRGPAFPVNITAAPTLDPQGKPLGLRWSVRDVTRRVQAEEALQDVRDHFERQGEARTAQLIATREELAREVERQRALFEAVLRQMPVGVLVGEAPTGKLTVVNESASRIWGLPAMASETIEEYAKLQGFHPDGRPYQPQDWPMARSLRAGEVVRDEEIEFIRGDGARGTILAGSAPIRDRDGNIVAAVVTINDITETRKATEALAQAYQWLQWLLDSLPVGVAIAHDPECRLITFNAVGATLFGAKVGDNVSVSAPGPDRLRYSHLQDGRALQPHELPLQRAVAENREIHDVEVEIVTPNGQRRDCRIDAAPVRDLNGDTVGGIAVIADITDQKRLLEVERARAREARRLDTIIELTRSGIAFLDTDFVFRRVNPRYAEFVNRRVEDLVGHDHFELFPNREVEAVFRRVVETREVVEYREMPYIFQRQPEAGVTYWDWMLAPLLNEQGEVEGLVLSSANVTEHVRAREAMVAAERTRAEMAETVAAEISHRMKNNLAIAAGLLHMQVADQPPDSAAAKTVGDAAARLRAFAVIHEQMYAAHADEIELVGTLTRLAETAREAVGAGGVAISVRGRALTLPSKNGTSLCIIANELITNAIKYGGPDQDGQRRIKIQLGTRDGKLRLTVWNSGNPVGSRFDPGQITSMGLRLVHEVALNQYQGSFTMRRRNHGTLAEIIIESDRLQGEA